MAGKVSYEVRRWGQGDYTLLHDTDMEQGQEFALDAVLHFNIEGPNYHSHSLINALFRPVSCGSLPSI